MQKKSAGSLPGPPSPTACVMLHGQENLKESVACKKFKKTYVCMYIKKKISRSPAGVSKPNSLCHVAWPGKIKKKQAGRLQGSPSPKPVSCCMARKK
jgi:hypothetical protein